MRSLRPAAVLLLAACYRYVPSADVPPAPAADVRLELTPAGAAGLAPFLGNATTAVEGRVLSASDSAYRLAVFGTLKAGDGVGATSSRIVWAGDLVTIPRAAVGGVERRTLDRRRTTLLAVIGALGAAATVQLLVHGGGGSGSGDGPPVVNP